MTISFEDYLIDPNLAKYYLIIIFPLISQFFFDTTSLNCIRRVTRITVRGVALEIIIT